MTKKSDRFSSAMVVVLLTMPMLGMGIDMVVPSLPAIAEEFGASQTAVKVSISLFLLGYAAMQIIAGFFVDRFGRRPLFLVGGSVFALCSFAASLSHSLSFFLAMRCLQGIALAAPGVAARAMIMDTLNVNERARASNYTAMTWSLGVILSPVLGGVLQLSLSWRASFYFMMLYATLLVLLMALKVPETKSPGDSVTLRQSIARFTFVLAKPTFLLYILAMSLAYAVMMIFHVVGPFLIQTVWQYSVASYSFASLGLGVAWLLGSISNRLLVQRGVRQSQVLQGSCGIFLLAASFLVWDGFFSAHLLALMIPVYVMTACMAIIFVIYMGKAMNVFQDGGGTVSALMGSFTMLGVSIATAVAAFLKSHSQVPLALAFLVIGLALCALVRFLPREESATHIGQAAV